MKLAAATLALLLTGCCTERVVVRPAPTTATVVRIVDGDTFVVSVDGGEGYCWQERVRIFGLWAAEKNEPGGAQATAALCSRMHEGTRVRLSYPERNKDGSTRWRDNFGRLLATFTVIEGE